MKSNQFKRSTVLLVTIVLAVSAIVVGVSRGRSEQAPKKKGPQPLVPSTVTQLPPVISKVKDLQVSSARIVRQGTPAAAIEIDIINNSDHALVTLNISSGDQNDWSSRTMDSLLEVDSLDEVKEFLMMPHSLKTFEWNLGAILENSPVFISGATFQDGTEDGDPYQIKIIHHTRSKAKEERQAAKQAEKKEVPK